MIKVGDIVTISPAHSLFGGRKGKIVAIKPEDKLFLKIKFFKNNKLGIFVFGFSFEEVVKEVRNE